MRDITNLKYSEMTREEKIEFEKQLRQLQSDLSNNLQNTIKRLSK